MRPWTPGLPMARAVTRLRAVSFHATLEPASQNFVADSAGPGTPVGATDRSPHAVAAIASAAHANHLKVMLFWHVMVAPNGDAVLDQEEYQRRRRREGRSRPREREAG